MQARAPHLNEAPQDHSGNDFPRAEQATSPTRSDQSVRAERAHRDWNAVPPTQRPLAIACDETAKALDAILHEHWLRGNEALSNTAIARAAGIDEKTVRQWRSGEKRVPLAALLVLPATLTSEIISWVIDRRKVAGDRRGAAQLRQGIDAIRASATKQNADELRRVVRDAQRQLLELDAQLDEVTR